MTDADADPWRFDGLRALMINCTLKRSPEPSHTQGLIDRSRAIMVRHGVIVGQDQALRDERSLQPPAPGLHDPAAGRRRLDRRGGAGPVLPRPGSGGPENDFTNRNTAFMTWNLLHLARMLKDAGGIPAHGNQRSEWEAGCRFDFANPDYR
jgi:hypothetical protein